MTGRPVGLRLPPYEPRDGLPPLGPLDGAARAGLADEQGRFLDAAASGRNVRLTGPGGSGKTTVLARYAAARASEGLAVVHAVTPDPASALAAHARCRKPTEFAAVVAEALADRRQGRGTCLVVDEYTSMGPGFEDGLGAFDQVLLAGDHAQGGYARHACLADALDARMGWTACTVRTLWRSSNQSQFSAANQCVYEGEYESLGSGDESPPDSRREASAPPGSGRDGQAAKAGVRLVRNVVANRGSSLMVVHGDRGSLLVMLAVAAHAALRPEVVASTRMAFAHVSMLRGREADVVMAPACCLVDHRGLPDATALTLMGRPRFRTELALPDAADETPEEAWMSSMLATRASGRAPGLKLAKLTEALASRGRSLEASLSALQVVATRTGAPVLLVSLAGATARQSLAAAHAAAGKRWEVASRLTGTLEDAAFDAADPECAALLAAASRRS